MELKPSNKPHINSRNIRKPAGSKPHLNNRTKDGFRTAMKPKSKLGGCKSCK